MQPNYWLGKVLLLTVVNQSCVTISSGSSALTSCVLIVWTCVISKVVHLCLINPDCSQLCFPSLFYLLLLYFLFFNLPPVLSVLLWLYLYWFLLKMLLSRTFRPCGINGGLLLLALFECYGENTKKKSCFSFPTRHQNDEELPVLVQETLEETHCGFWVHHIVQHLCIYQRKSFFDHIHSKRTE